MRLLVFMLVELVLCSISLAGAAAYLVKLKLYNQPKGISGTAYEPFFGRAMAHGMGARDDTSAYLLAPGLPALSPLIWWLLMWPTGLASRIAGYKPALFAGPTTRPAKLMQMMALRNEFFDETLREAAAVVEQVVILGAGWDTRAYEQLKGADVRIFEVDTPATQQAKVEALNAAGIDSSHVTFVETDFNQASWLEALRQHGFDPARTTYILWEGVTMYLPEDAVRETLACVTDLAPGSRIAFDYFANELIEGKGALKVLAWCFRVGIGLTYGEHFMFGLPMRTAARDTAAAFLESSGLTLGRYETLGAEGKLVVFYGFAVGEHR